MLKLSFFLFVFCFLNAAFGFEFNPATCSVTSTQNVKFEGPSTFQSKVKTEFTFSDTGLPLLSLTFLENAPVTSSLSWPNSVIQRNNKNFFTEQIMDNVRALQSQSLPLTKITDFPNPLVFDTSLAPLSQLQALVAMFLTQNTMTLSVQGSDSISWEGSISLNSSDLAYRQMASRCFPDLSSNYLNMDGTRKIQPDAPETLSTFAISVSNGYGLVDLTSLVDLMPVITPWEQIEDKSAILDLLATKRSLVLEMNEFFVDSSFQEAADEIQALLQKQKSLAERLSLISAPSIGDSKNLILQNEEQTRFFQEELVATEAKIKELELGLLALTNSQSSNNGSLEPFLPQLNAFEQKIMEARTQVDSLNSYKRDIEALIQTYKNQLTAEFFQTADSAALIAAPWSLEEIEKRNSELKPKLQTYQALLEIKEKIDAMSTVFDALVLRSQQISVDNTRFLSLKSKKSQQEQALVDLENQISKLQNVPYLSNVDAVQFSVLMSLTETKAAQSTRDYESEFAYHEKEFNTLAGKFRQSLQVIAKQNNPWADLICDWQQLLNAGFNMQMAGCLTTVDFLNQTVRTSFLETLSPQRLDSLIDIPTQPWTRDISKIEYVAQNIEQKVAALNSEMTVLVEAEQLLRMIIWRWNAQQKELQAISECQSPDLENMIREEKFSDQFYELVFNCEEKKLESVLQQRETALTSMLAISIEANALKTDLDLRQNQLASESKDFSNTISEMISQTQGSEVVADLYRACLDLTVSLQDCQVSFSTQIEFQDEFVAQINELALQVRSRSLLLQNEVATLNGTIDSTTAEKTNFIQQNQLEPLLALRDQLTADIANHQRQMQELQRLMEIKNQSVLNNQAALHALQEEASQIVVQQTMLSTQIKNLQSSWIPACSEVESIKIEIASVDQNLKNLVAQENTQQEQKENIPATALLLCP